MFAGGVWRYDSFASALGQADGPMLAGFFRANAAGVATDADDRILHDTTDGRLFYDTNGDSAGGRRLLAVLSGAPTIDAGEFFIS